MLPNPLTRPIRVLAYGDAPCATTGFGRINRETLERLDPAKYHVDMVGLNYHAAPLEVDRGWPHMEHGWRLYSAHNDPKDRMYGRQLLVDVALNAAQNNEPYDVLWLHNDLAILNPLCNALDGGLREKAQLAGVALYAPLDFDLKGRTELTTILTDVDYSATYSWWAKNEIENSSRAAVHVIQPGSAQDWCFPETLERIHAFRADYLSTPDPDTFLVVSINRNQDRKDLPRLLAAFQQFHEQVPNSKLYLHCHFIDQWADLSAAIIHLGLRGAVTLPHAEVAHSVLDDETLRLIHNSAHVYMSLSRGEGWGLGATEAMAAGRPVALALNTAAHDILGTALDPLDDNQTWLYERGVAIASGADGRGRIDMNLWDWGVDSVCRPMADIPHAASALSYIHGQYGEVRGYRLREGQFQESVEYAQAWASNTLSWDKAAGSWDKVFTEMVTAREHGAALPRPIRSNGA